ncbi:hypothetical protein V5F63_09950 [Xanthobacter autotrophicus DSM 597]|uniref:hypothetical protein n=1 Tax=Xanthobacter TaxID=279 RepID=UPI001AE8942F|nr:hypothetical protein [Xanthobacter flavus]MBP2150306.1 hypothetical protein [Xanthobacter flavus]
MTRRTSAGRPGRALAISPQLPAVQFEHQPELRALMILPTLPPGHMTFPVEDDAFYPHLRRGEFAVVDLADHLPARGELFLISFSDPRVESGLAFALCMMRGSHWFRRADGVNVRSPEPGAEPETTWTACFWIPPESRDEYQRLLQAGRIGTCDGPMREDYAAERLVGRVVGVWVPGPGF